MIHRQQAEQESSDDLAATLDAFGFDAAWQEHLISQVRSGHISMRKNHLSAQSSLDNICKQEVEQQPTQRHFEQAEKLLQQGCVATLTLAGGLGSRWSGGAGVVKALAPVAKFHGKWRSFLELNLRKFHQADQTARQHIVFPVVFLPIIHCSAP